MKILIVCRNKNGISPFILEQADSVRKKGAEVHYHQISGKGIMAYIHSLSSYRKKYKEFYPDIIHAHYGLSGLFANYQRSIPVITTFHGSDINFKKIRPFSKLAARLSKKNIFISRNLADKMSCNNFAIQACGVDTKTFYPVSKGFARKELNLASNENIILFSGSFSNAVKNVTLAKKAISLIDKKIRLIELQGYSRQEVNLLLNACDVLLLTSISEGSPQIIKEAMACNCPIVSTDVGDVKQNIEPLDGCYISSFEPFDIAEKIEMVLRFKTRTKGKDRIRELGLDLEAVANKIISIYSAVLKN